MTATFSRRDARHFYDRFGAKQDRQGFYEDAALDALIRHGRFSDAGSVLEIGCGTGRLAARLLSDHLPRSARYVGLDLSATMIDLATVRLASWAERCQLKLSDGDFDFSSCGGPFERIVSTYVFDLLSHADIAAVLAAAHGVMQQGGLLCLAGITRGSGPVSAVTSKLWTLAYAVNPALVGGCRPTVLADLIPERQWRIVHREVVVSATVPSEVLIVRAL